MINKPVIIISGPTASGKTNCSLNIANYFKKKHKLKAAIVNFDSLLFYRELNIGTAKPSENELSVVEHHMINIASAKEPINASQYINQTKPIIDNLHSAGKIVILVGGSGFYLRALIKGMYGGHTTPIKIKSEVTRIYTNFGIEKLREFLKQNDPESHSFLHKNDHYRIRRAVEFFLSTNQKISLERTKQDYKNPYNLLEDCATDWNIYNCYLDLPKPLHYEIITKRTTQMLHNGLVQEVKDLLENGFTGEEKPMNSIGYRETLNFLQGNISSLGELAERISISTRQLAKAQRTFFKKISPKYDYDPLADQQLINENIFKFLE